MRHTERARIAAQRRQSLQEIGVRRSCEQHCQQRIFLRARGIDFININVAGVARALAVKIGSQQRPVDPGCGLDCDHAFGGYARPIGNGRLRDPKLARQRADTARGADCFIESDIPHLGAHLRMRLIKK